MIVAIEFKKHVEKLSKGFVASSAHPHSDTKINHESKEISNRKSLGQPL